MEWIMGVSMGEIPRCGRVLRCKSNSMSMGVSMGEIPHCARDDNVQHKERALGLDIQSNMYDLEGQAIVYLLTLSSRA
jgi:hypothetical protein